MSRANDWFNKINEITAGEPNKPSPYIRNTYGGSIGGPILAAFRHDYPGESGARNNLRGPGYFGIGMSLQKTWNLGEARSLRFGWDVFNITNSIRFDAAQTIRRSPDVASVFGQYFNTLTEPRRMQFSLRFAF